MLREIEIRNFLSYEHEKIQFTPDATIAVVGENGHGKSGLLEAILFCLYGEGREDLSKLVRIGSDGGMVVRLTMEGVPAKAKSLVVERGVKRTGAGYTKVWLNENLIAQGGATASKNNKAQEYIDAALGVDKESFLLTSFFGLGSNDSLMQVAPSARLETLQKLAGVDICMEFNKVANDYAKGLSQTIEKTKAVIAAIQETVEDVDALTDELKEKSKEYKTCKLDIDALQKERSELAKEETRYQNLLQEKESVRGKREGKLQLKERAERTLLNAKTVLKRAKDEASSCLAEKREIEDKIKSMKTVEEYKKELDLIYKERVKREATTSILNVAVRMEGSSKCPLCGAKTTENQVSLWKDQVADLEKEMQDYKVKYTSIKASMETRSSYDNRLERIATSMKCGVEDVREAEEEVAAGEKELASVSAALNSLETRLVAIGKELRGYDELLDSINAKDARMNKLLGKSGSLAQSVSDIKNRIERNENSGLKVKEHEIANENNTEKMLAYKVVADAFSRYAIPVQLLRNLRTAVERRATKVYQYFTSGVIKIDDVEGARPGVEFVLYDEMGARSYKSLSAGEKVMVFLSVRVAITQIINASRNNKVEFLILDEIAGNLDPIRRDALTKLINSLLRKFFSQVFMVSHVELRDIFNETIFVRKTNGISHAKVSS
jgi:DNA repair exonuclease SbcCD ATPase subunit